MFRSFGLKAPNVIVFGAENGTKTESASWPTFLATKSRSRSSRLMLALLSQEQRRASFTGWTIIEDHERRLVGVGHPLKIIPGGWHEIPGGRWLAAAVWVGAQPHEGGGGYRLGIVSDRFLSTF